MFFVIKIVGICCLSLILGAALGFFVYALTAKPGDEGCLPYAAIGALIGLLFCMAGTLICDEKFQKTTTVQVKSYELVDDSLKYIDNNNNIKIIDIDDSINIKLINTEDKDISIDFSRGIFYENIKEITIYD